MKEHDITEQAFKNGYEKGKQEVARDVFEEMESDTNRAISFVENEKSYTEEIRKAKLECYQDILGYFAELKKKYIGEKK